MSGYFIAAIGTGVGKTFVTCALAHQLQIAGRAVRALKPVISGFDVAHPENSDTGQLLLAQRMEVSPQNIEKISPWRFAAPLSPHLAAAYEGKLIAPAELETWCRAQMHDSSTTLIEGAGGLMVPLAPDYLLIDWAAALGLPVVLVASNYLGAINHTLLSVEALRARAIPLQAVVISQAPETETSLEDTAEAIAAFVPKDTRIHTLARQKSTDCGWKHAPDLLSLLP